jgi:hypothetical protein
MMMRCLEAGGLSPIYDKGADVMNHSAPLDYVPNPNGFYQFTNEITPDFVQLYDGMLVKCPIRKLLWLPLGDYKLVIMKRDPIEIRASMSKWTPYQSWGKDEVITHTYDLFIDSLIVELTKRGDMDVTILNYADIVTNPIVEFTKLISWGVDVPAMAALVQPELYRLKLEDIYGKSRAE